MKIEKFVRESHIWHSISLLVRGRRPCLISSRSHLFITGFPRSGNTFFSRLTHAALPHLNIVSHVHTVGSIKRALQLKIPTLILVREPAQAISSLVLKNRCRGRGSIEEVVDYYNQYHSFILSLKDRDDIKLINFARAINEMEYWFDEIKQFYDFEIDKQKIEESVATATEWITTATKNRRIINKNLGNAVKENEKTIIIRKLVNNVKFLKSVDLYEDISRVWENGRET